MGRSNAESEQTKAGSATGHAALIFAGCLASLIVIGWLDYITGYELGFFVFYSIPVGLAAWYAGRWPAIGVALGATVAWWLADYYSGARYSAPFYYYWNGTIHFLAFVINAVSIAGIKSELNRRHESEKQLAATRETLNAALALVAACPICGKPRRRSEEEAGSESQALLSRHPELASTVCADCRRPSSPAKK